MGHQVYGARRLTTDAHPTLSNGSRGRHSGLGTCGFGPRAAVTSRSLTPRLSVQRGPGPSVFQRTLRFKCLQHRSPLRVAGSNDCLFLLVTEPGRKRNV